MLFVDARLIVEVDGYAVHSKPEQFELDRIRGNALLLAGYRVLRFTYKRITEQPALVLDEIRAALAV